MLGEKEKENLALRISLEVLKLQHFPPQTLHQCSLGKSQLLHEFLDFVVTEKRLLKDSEREDKETNSRTGVFCCFFLFFLHLCIFETLKS